MTGGPVEQLLSFTLLALVAAASLAAGEDASSDCAQGKPLDVRIRALAREGRHAAAAATAGKLHDLAPTPDNLYNAACGYALCVSAVAPGKPPEKLSAEEKAARDRYAARAVALLADAIDASSRQS